MKRCDGLFFYFSFGKKIWRFSEFSISLEHQNDVLCFSSGKGRWKIFFCWMYRDVVTHFKKFNEWTLTIYVMLLYFFANSLSSALNKSLIGVIHKWCWQRIRSHEDETRRACSYHSYSQSPPYDFQYEDRRYGKQTNTLTRKPGSDRSLNVGKMASFICSPTRLNERVFEDRFANEGSVSRVSDYSVSSGGDPVRSGAESPNFQKDIAFSPPIQPSRDGLGDVKHQKANSFSEASFKRDADGIPHPQVIFHLVFMLIMWICLGNMWLVIFI